MKQMFGRSKRIVAVAAALGVGMLLGRHGFARQRRLVDEQILGFEQAQIGWDHVAGGKPHHIARNQLLDRDFGRTDRPIGSGARLTLAVVWTIARSRAAASFERCSWMNAVVIASTTMVAITMAARTSPRK